MICAGSVRDQIDICAGCWTSHELIGFGTGLEPNLDLSQTQGYA